MRMQTLIGIIIVILFFVLWIVHLYRSYSKLLPKPIYKERIELPKWQNWPDTEATITWIGHSTVLIRMCDMYILTDPVFTKRVGVRLGWFKIGPKRFSDPALYPDELPPIDVVLLSHAHMDHLDLQSLRKVVTNRTMVVTAQNTGKVLKFIKAKEIIELGPNESLRFENGLEVHTVLVNHWGNRFPWNKRFGWTGYLIDGGDARVFFAGDTSYVDTFSSLRDEFGEIDVACIPIGAYKPESFLEAHCTPEQAWAMFLDSGAKWLIPIHWNTFVLSQEPVEEPINRLLLAAKSDADRIVIRQQGQVFTVREIL